KHNSVVRLELVGTRGEIAEQWFRDPGRAVLAAGADNWMFERQAEAAFGPAAPFPLDYLIGCLERGESAATTIRDARAALEIALAAYESARRGAPVRLAGDQEARPPAE